MCYYASSGIRAQKVFCGYVFIFYRLKRENLDTKRLGQERKEDKGLKRGIKDKKKTRKDRNIGKRRKGAYKEVGGTS